MRWSELATELGTQPFIAGLKALKRRVSKRRYKQLIATTVAQILALHPDLGPKKARRLAEKVAGIAPSKKLITGKIARGAGKAAEAAAASLIAGGAIKAVKAARTRRRAPRRSAMNPGKEPTE